MLPPQRFHKIDQKVNLSKKKDSFVTWPSEYKYYVLCSDSLNGAEMVKSLADFLELSSLK